MNMYCFIPILLLSAAVSGKHILKLTSHQIAEIEANCEMTNCNVQTEDAKRSREGIKQLFTDMALERGYENDRRRRALAEDEAEETLQLIQEAKRAVHKSMGLKNVEPLDTGLWQGDVLLRKEEAIKYIVEYGGELPKNLRGKRSVYSPDVTNSAKRWTSPIPYYVDSTLAANVAPLVQIALNQVTQQVPCLVFQQVFSQPTSGNYLQYTYKTFGGCGGSAYIGLNTQYYAGKVSNNPVNLDLTATFCAQWKSGPMTNTSANRIITHETFHALGMSHEQQRGDLSNFITIQTSNVQPSQMSNFNQDSNSTFTTYGQTYNYFSMMQYPSTTFAINSALPTMTALLGNTTANTAAMGNPGGQIANISDVIILNRTYCQNPNTWTPYIVNYTTTSGCWPGTTAIPNAACLTQASATPAAPQACPSGYTQTNYMPVECVVCPSGSCSTPAAGDDWAAQAYRMSTSSSCGNSANSVMSISVRQCQSNTPVCGDMSALCGYWAQQGQCSQATIQTQCPKSCGTSVCSQYYNNGSG